MSQLLHSRLLPKSLPCRVAAFSAVLCWSVAAQSFAQTPAPAGSSAPATPAASPASATAGDVLSVAEAAGNFKTFLKAVEAAGMTAALKKPGPFTVFAPTDEAFAKLPAGRLDELLKPENKPKLLGLVSYHIASRKLTVAEIAKLDEIKTVEGTELDVDASADGKTVELDDAKITSSDVAASNGLIQVIDKVLQP